MNKKKDMNIKPYDGQDAFYTGTDEEYEEFLKNADVHIDSDEHETEPVSNTQRINLGDTINLQNVINKFKKTAGEIGQGAKAIKNSVVNKVDSMKTKMAEKAEDADGKTQEIRVKAEEPPAEPANSGAQSAENTEKNVNADSQEVTEKLAGSFKKIDVLHSELQSEIHAMAEIPQRVDNVGAKIDEASGAVSELNNELNARLDDLEKRLDKIEKRIDENRKSSKRRTENIEDTLRLISDGMAEVRRSVGSVSKLNDSVFDLKNTQMNTKNSVSSLETAFNRLRRKCVLGVTVLSLLSAITIGLLVLLMLS